MSPHRKKEKSGIEGNLGEQCQAAVQILDSLTFYEHFWKYHLSACCVAGNSTLFMSADTSTDT